MKKTHPALLLCLILAACVSNPPRPAPALAFGHVALTVASVESSTIWYQKALGFTLIGSVYDIRVDDSPLGKVARALFGAELRRLRIAQLQTPDGGVRVELFELTEPRTESTGRPATSGFIHMAVVSGDFAGTLLRLEAAGARRIVSNDSNPERRVAFFADPDGNVIEIDAAPWQAPATP